MMVNRREKPRSIKKEKLRKQKWDVETTQCCSTVVYISLYVLQCLLQNWLQNINVTSNGMVVCMECGHLVCLEGLEWGADLPRHLCASIFFIFFAGFILIIFH